MTTARTRAALAAISTVLLTSACGGGGDPQAAESTPSAGAPTGDAPAEELDPALCVDPGYFDQHVEFCANGDPIETEAPVTEQPHVEWPDGLRAEITGVTAQSTDQYASDQPDHDTEIRVTVQLSNVGPREVPLDGSYGGALSDHLFYGENRYEAQGWMAMDNAEGSDSLPQRLVPGTSAQYVCVFSLPSAEADVLAFSFSPDPVVYPPHTFTGVETLLG